MSQNMFVLAEIRHGALRHVSFEAIAAAKKLTTSGKVTAVLLGEKVERFTELLFQYGADRVIIAEHPDLDAYRPEAYKQALLQIIEEERPDGFLFAHTSQGRDLAPRIAASLKSGLISDVVKLELVDDRVVFTRPIYSGKAFEEKIIEEGMIMATIRPNNIQAAESDPSRSGEIKTVYPDIKDFHTTIKDIVEKTTSGVDLTEANIVVAGGRGVKSKDGFHPLQELADVLGAAVGASRGACDADYCDYSLQIGQTGKVVTPDLYIACGISGAIQHVAGMSNSKVIVAINKDPEAPIFSIADYGIVGDLFEVLPVLTEECRKVVTSKA
ncbi:electron transfer flavoprotein subunit alpha/FixB family protein [Alkalihalobacillus oceani]|uniref:Electron transfer flavoprotein subunit alpha/FixB family protein n=1 Tax=Halalkalibacter oceani TaxID=1653776 RepID=A0A9X2DRN1_9BACI|nr:electron transfer flavoprotein subunit alpha/FixB family protein [Halalkalibacter oceani]MCM3715203.1 electron transfer flavoprotein subunit alpha/FixB family protein [Halalkalibacter oceani]